MQTISNLPLALDARLFKTNGGLCGALMCYTYSQKWQESTFSKLEFMPVANEVGKMVKTFVLIFIGKYNR